nr:putative phage tail protein [uncultured Peptostreptococcus sp.]
MIGFKDEYMPKCIDFIPPVYADIKEFQALAKSYNAELTLTANRLDEIHNNFFIDGLNDYGCSRWENILGLKSNSSFTLDERRFAIKTKLVGQRPYTYKKLASLLDNLVGVDGYKMKLDPVSNHLLVRLDLGAKRMMYAVNDLLENVVPQNISLEIELLYNTHEILSGKTHNDLAGYTHEALKEEVFR